MDLKINKLKPTSPWLILTIPQFLFASFTLSKLSVANLSGWNSS